VLRSDVVAGRARGPEPPRAWTGRLRQLVEASRRAEAGPSWWSPMTAYFGSVETRTDAREYRWDGMTRLRRHDRPLVFFQFTLAGWGHFELYGKPARRGKGSDNGLDVVVNYTGGDTWTKSLRVLKVGGRLLTCGATAGYDPPEDIRFIWTFELQILGSNGWARDDVGALLEMVRTGDLQAVIDDTFPLERVPEALARLEERRVFGKLVVTP